MAGLVPAIHADPLHIVLESFAMRRRLDGRDKPGHDGGRFSAPRHFALNGYRFRLYRHSLTSTNRPAIAAAAAIAGETRWVRPL